MRILGADIAFYLGWVLIDYSPKDKTIKLIDYGTFNVKNKKSHKEYYLYEETKKLLDITQPSLVIYESQFDKLMYRIEGSFTSAINPSIQTEKIFSKRARFLAFNNGGLSKEEANDLITERYPELKGKESDVLDAMTLFEAWRIAFETGQPLKAPKKPKKIKTLKEPKAAKPKAKKEKPKH